MVSLKGEGKMAWFLVMVPLWGRTKGAMGISDPFGGVGPSCPTPLPLPTLGTWRWGQGAGRSRCG